MLNETCNTSCPLSILVVLPFVFGCWHGSHDSYVFEAGLEQEQKIDKSCPCTIHPIVPTAAATTVPNEDEKCASKKLVSLEKEFETYINHTLPVEFWGPITQQEEERVTEKLKEDPGVWVVSGLLFRDGSAFDRTGFYEEVRAERWMELGDRYDKMKEERCSDLATFRSVQLHMNWICERRGVTRDSPISVDDSYGGDVDRLERRLAYLLFLPHYHFRSDLEEIKDRRVEPLANWVEDVYLAFEEFETVRSFCLETFEYWSPEERRELEDIINL